MRETLNLLNGVITGRRILNEGRVGQIADDLESLSDAEFQKEYGKTKEEMRKTFPDKEEVKEMDYGGGRSPYAGMGLPRDDENDAGKREVMVKPITVKKMKKDANDMMDKEFSKSYDKTSAIKEGIPNSDEDPNLAKAYNMGHDAYRAYKNDPEMAQAAQDRIEAKFPQYAKMWLMGYHDGERFAAQEALNEDSHSVEDMAETALNAAAKSIQDALGVTDGDVAADFFTGENAAVIMNILSEYIEQEMSMRGDEI